ncbi:MAG: hypothetical protein PUB18_01310 [bacterium]|nr:hypothetical protein [bacterium]
MDNHMGEVKGIGHKKNKAILFIIGLCVVALVLVGVIFYTVSKPKTVLLQSIQNLANNTKDLLEVSDTPILKKLATEDTVHVHSNVDITLNGQSFMGFDLSYLENKAEQKSSFRASLLQDGSSILELNGLLANNRVYVKMKDIMDYYYTEFAYMSLFEEVSVEHYNKVIDMFKDNFIEQLNENDIKRSKETISYFGKDKKVTKLSYLVTEKMIRQVTEATIADIQKDKDLLKELASITGVSEDEFVKQLTDSIGSDDGSNSSLYYNVYYYGFNNIVMYELADGEVAIQFYDIGDDFKIAICENNQELFVLEATKEKDQYQLSGNLSNYTFDGSYTGNDSNSELKINMTIEGVVFHIAFHDEIKENTDELYRVESKFSFGVIGFVVQANMNTTYRFDGTVEVTGIEQAKSFDAMTEEEKNLILQNFQNHPFISSLMSLIDTYMPTDIIS